MKGVCLFVGRSVYPYVGNLFLIARKLLRGGVRPLVHWFIKKQHETLEKTSKGAVYTACVAPSWPKNESVTDQRTDVRTEGLAASRLKMILEVKTYDFVSLFLFLTNVFGVKQLMSACT